MLIWLLACQGDPLPEDTSAQAEDRLESLSTYTADLEDDEVEPVDLELLQIETQAVIDRLVSLNGSAVAPAFEATRAWGDENCPLYNFYSETASYYDCSCNTRDGSSFYGDAFYATYEGTEDDGETFERFELFSHARSEGISGERFYSAGSTVVESRTYADGSARFFSRDLGLMFSDVEGTADSWISSGLQNDMTQTLTTTSGGMPASFNANGSIASLGGTFDAIWLESFLIGSEASGWQCAGEPSSALWMRRDDGLWVEITFDVPQGSAEAPEDRTLCDGCGRATVGGVDIGAICLDFSALFDWSGAPW